LISKKVTRLGSNFYGGTNLAQPFMKAMEHFREMGQSTSRLLVFLSDGEATIPAMMKQTIVTEMKKMDIHLYLLGINLTERSGDILEIVGGAQGRFIPTESEGELSSAFDEIDRLEANTVEIEVQGKGRELYPIALILAICILFSWTLLRSTLFIELC